MSWTDLQSMTMEQVGVELELGPTEVDRVETVRREKQRQALIDLARAMRMTLPQLAALGAEKIATRLSERFGRAVNGTQVSAVLSDLELEAGGIHG